MFAFAAAACWAYLAWNIAWLLLVAALRLLYGALRLLLSPLLWLAHRQALEVQRRRQRAATMARFRRLAGG
jgi:hypothetical protein